MTNVYVQQVPASAFPPLSFVPWQSLSQNRGNERAKIYLPAYSESTEDITHSLTEEGILEIRTAFAMPSSDRLVPVLIMETEHPNQSPRNYLRELMDPDGCPTDMQSELDLTNLEELLRSFHAHHLSFNSYPHHGTSHKTTLILTTAFKSSDIGGDNIALASAFRHYPFNFRIYSGDFPSYGEEHSRAYDGTIIITGAENADNLVERITETANTKEIIVTREKLVGSKKVFSNKIS